MGARPSRLPISLGRGIQARGGRRESNTGQRPGARSKAALVHRGRRRIGSPRFGAKPGQGA